MAVLVVIVQICKFQKQNVFDFENFQKNSESCIVNNITVFELDCDFLILISN